MRPVPTDKRGCTRTRGGAVGAAAVAFTLALAGCLSPMERLDRDAQAMIDRRETLALGTSSAQDPDPTPPAPGPTPGRTGLYDEKPATNDPSLDALPAETDTVPEVDTDTLPPPIVDAGEPLEFDLEGVLGYAVQHAPNYRREKEDLFLTTLALIVERHLWGPRFFSGIRGQLDGTPESGDYDTASSLIADFGVTQRLPYGGSISAAALVDYVAFLQKSSTNTDPDETQSFGINVAMELPLLRGAGMVAREGLIQAERDLIYAVRQFERYRREFLVILAAQYFDLVFAQQRIRNQELQLNNLAFVANQYRALADAGKIRGYEAEDIEQDVLSARNTLLNLRESYANDLDGFKIDLGMDMSTPLVIKPVSVSVPPPLLDMQSAVATAWALRLDLQTARDTVEDAQRAVRNARNGLLPDLDLEAELNLRSDDGKDIAGFDLDAGDSDYRVAMDFELPLDRRIEWSNLRAAQVRAQRQEREYGVFRDGVALEVRRSIREIEQARFTLELQKRNVMLNERRALEVSIRRRSLQPRDVIEAQEDLAAARNSRDRAAADLRTEVLRYLLATGQMRVGPDGAWLAPADLTPLAIDPADSDMGNKLPDLEGVDLPPEPGPAPAIELPD